MKKIVNIIMKVIHIIFPYSFITTIGRIHTSIYTAWIKNEFKISGNISIKGNLNLLGGNFITIGNKTGFGRHGVLQAWNNYKGEKFNPSITIGNDCWIGDYFNISAIKSITIGNRVLMGRWVTILDNSHGKTAFEDLIIPPRIRPLFSKGEVVIEDDVWIGDKVSILPGVHIGKGAVIGSNSVVTKDIPAYTVACGIPCKIIKHNGL